MSVPYPRRTRLPEEECHAELAPARARIETATEVLRAQGWTEEPCPTHSIETGHVVAWMTPDRSPPYALAFLDHLVRFYRRGRLVIITDKLSNPLAPCIVATTTRFASGTRSLSMSSRRAVRFTLERASAA